RARGRSDLRLRVADATGTLGVIFFGQGFLARVLPEGATIALVGQLAPGPGRTFANPLFELLPDDAAAQLAAGRIVPRHPLTAGVSGRQLRTWIRSALDATADELAAADPLPAALRARLGL